MPRFALANNMWIGPIPHELAVLTLPEELLISRHFPQCYIFKLYPKDTHGADPSHLQQGMAGNVTLYNMNTDDVAKMIEGQFLPQPVTSLASVLAAHNPLYVDIQISAAQLAYLPEDDVPQEIVSIVHHEASDNIAMQESEGYMATDDGVTNNDNDIPDLENEGYNIGGDSDIDSKHVYGFEMNAHVIPLKFLGVTDTELSTLPLNDLMKHALMNIDGMSEKEGGYAICHGHHPVSDFGRNQVGGEDSDRKNPLAATYPKLFPYGYHDHQFRTYHSFPFVIFGMEQKRKALQSAQIQMHCKDFKHNGFIINSVTIFAGEEINMDDFPLLPAQIAITELKTLPGILLPLQSSTFSTLPDQNQRKLSA
ncbi:uncharacterized protein EDB91DRAFT_1086323 [Suillus paluster]|uniref:uncharacterized protein n=1 Tax=Suillus paluster TaxID=48578 RepID=UPI001B87FAEE|nr:uncharacterized protein EDB91DRAFT_1086323 [Suillus paluster]KAG1727657.1 hypothetical protein EDB91DRAFT_1086323 [Suillus paluster]